MIHTLASSAVVHVHAYNVFPTRFSLADILVLGGGTILLAPIVPACTRISARLKRNGSQFSRDAGVDASSAHRSCSWGSHVLSEADG